MNDLEVATLLERLDALQARVDLANLEAGIAGLDAQADAALVFGGALVDEWPRLRRALQRAVDRAVVVTRDPCLVAALVDRWADLLQEGRRP